MKVPKGEFWLPISISYAMGEPIVSISRLSERPTGFLSDVDLHSKAGALKLPLNDIEIDDTKLSEIDAVVFHLPRSGSTAVAQALAKLDNSSCFFEPAPLDQLLSPQFASVSNKEVSLKKLLWLYGAIKESKDHKVFIKLSSWSTLNINAYRLAMPNTPFFFVHRNPVEVLAQILTRPTGWMQSPARFSIENHLGLDTAESIEEYCGNMLGLFCQRILEANPTPSLIDHATLRESAIKSIKQNITSQLSQSELLRMSKSFDMDSEHWDAPVKYSPDSVHIIGGANNDLIRICDLMISPYLFKLRANSEKNTQNEETLAAKTLPAGL